MPKHSPGALRRPLVALAVVVALACGGCTSPNALAQFQGQLNDAADALNDVRVNLATLNGTVDSLRTVIAKQDTTISRLANATGVQIVK